MMRTSIITLVRGIADERPGGQILVIFALSLVALISLTGLALDGGATFSQRRDQQTAADLAALAGANDYLINNNDDQAIARATTVAASNGFTTGVDDTIVTVSIDTANGVEVTVGIEKPHRNSFLALVGMPQWQVSTSASALAGFPDSAAGAGPFIFSIGAFDNDGTPRYQTATDFGTGNGDVPVNDLDFSWTNFGTGNVNTSEVTDIINGTTTINKTLAYGEYIGQHNNGNHTALYEDVDSYLSGLDIPVAVVDTNGNFMGWATFHVNSASGSSNKHINGYFVSSFESARLTVASCASNACPRYLGSYVLKLSD
jgi:Flp pilus assembly protein TadG